MTAPLRRYRLRASAAATLAQVLAIAAVGCGEPLQPDPAARVVPVERPAVVRGIYVNAFAAGSPSRLASLLALADGSTLNTFVVDVKENGEVSYASAVPVVGLVGSGRAYIADLPGLLRALRDHDIYPIARIVCFRDPILAEARPEWAIRTTTGDVWVDPESGRPWVDPFNADVWAYNIALAREALAAGFAEVQWDYVRLPDVADSLRAGMVFPARAGRSAGAAIEEFVAKSRSELGALGAPITVDVFGRVVSTVGDDGIGQDWDRLVRVSDVILPMIYPALYSSGSFGIPDPNADPYRLVRTALDSAVVRMDRTAGAIATIRPWIQAFTQGGTSYGVPEIDAQLRAVEDAGLGEWLAWNPGSEYPAGAFQ